LPAYVFFLYPDQLITPMSDVASTDPSKVPVEKKEFTCGECGVVFPQQAELDGHKEATNHGDKPKEPPKQA
jgi:hypothetical protein